MSCLTDSYGCAPDSGYFFPLFETTTLHGVPFPPVATAFCTSSSICASYFLLVRQRANFAVSSPISFAIWGSTVSMFVRSFEGVSSKNRSVYFQKTSLLVPRELEGPPCSAAHSAATASLRA